MIQKVNPYKGISLFIKLAIVGLSLYYIYYKIFQDVHPEISNQLKGLSVKVNVLSIVSVFALMLLNWSLEALKWEIIVNQLQTIGFLKSLRAIFAGISVSIFTPNRIGEFGGRIFFLEAG